MNHNRTVARVARSARTAQKSAFVAIARRSKSRAAVRVATELVAGRLGTLVRHSSGAAVVLDSPIVDPSREDAFSGIPLWTLIRKDVPFEI